MDEETYLYSLQHNISFMFFSFECSFLFILIIWVSDSLYKKG